MTFLLHFLLAHFLADYPLQSTSLVQLKMKRFLGVFIHGGIHLVTMLIILFPLLHSPKVWLAILVIYVTHNIIDQTKVKLDQENPQKARFFYFLDQTLHWSIILLMSFYVGEVHPHLSASWAAIYTDPTLLLFLLTLIVSTYFYDVSRYFLLLKVKRQPYHRDYKTMGVNALLVIVAFGLYEVFYA